MEQSQVSGLGIWEKVLNILSVEVDNKDGFATWLGPTKGMELKDNVLMVEVPNQFFIEWISQYYITAIEDAVKRVCGNEIRLVFRVKDGKDKNSTELIPRRTVRIPLDVSKLQDRYTFDSFVVGECNRFAYAASKAVAEAPAETYNPLLIYGGVGLGKTHLLHAIGNHAKKLSPSLRIYYTPAENLFIELIQAIERGNTLEFKNKYRTQDILLIDDIHYLRGKERLQEEIFHIFNNMYNAGKQVAITSDRPPYEIPTLEERLTSRLQAGLVVDLQPPDLETRIAILRKKAENEGFELNQDIAYIIASKVRTNIRTLEGCLIRLLAISSIEGKAITPELACETLSCIIPKTDTVSAEKIIEKVSQEFKIKPNDLKAKIRTKKTALARQVGMYLMRQLLGYSLKEVGAYFGGKDHTTVLYACEKISELRNKDPQLDDCIRRITMGINSS